MAKKLRRAITLKQYKKLLGCLRGAKATRAIILDFPKYITNVYKGALIMITAHAIQTAIEIIVIGALIVGLFNESKLVAFEEKIAKNFLNKTRHFVTK